MGTCAVYLGDSGTSVPHLATFNFASSSICNYGAAFA